MDTLVCCRGPNPLAHHDGETSGGYGFAFLVNSIVLIASQAEFLYILISTGLICTSNMLTRVGIRVLCFSRACAVFLDRIRREGMSV